ncbi:hypothetical protein [Myxococcus phage Mx4 ts27htf-1hrm-1]|nr:hypothetical protein [Myxococcus phage Mx4 ts27htf-1hrm-1]
MASEQPVALAQVDATPRAIITRDILKYEAEQRKMLAEYVKQQMVDGTDYGVIPGTQKPTLLKPGAEKLITLFRCTPKFTLLDKQSTQDFDRGFFNYVFRCRIYSRDAEAVVAEGFGSANSYESRYRWRDGKRKCPSCGSEALLMSKDKPEWFCWRKKGGCGAVFPKADERITGQQVGRVENPDLPDMANTVLKMAKKRALVDASIALARCSDMFTQDVEDFGPDAPPEDMGPPAPPPNDEQQRPTQRRQNAAPAKESKPVDVPRSDSKGRGPPTAGGAPAQQEPQRRSAQTPAPPKAQERQAPAPAKEAPTEPTPIAASDGTVAAAKCGFGPWKGKALKLMSDDELGAAVDMANMKLLEQPGAKWAPAMESNRDLLLSEISRRGMLAVQNGRQPGEEG